MQIKFYSLILILVLPIVFLLCCNQVASKKQVDDIKLKITLNDNIKLPISKVFQRIEIVPIKQSANSYFGMNIKMLYKDDLYYILDKDTMKIFIVNQSGEIISVIDKVGLGPDQYRNIVDFSINPQTSNVEILAYNNVFVQLDKDGNVKKKIRLNVPDSIPTFHRFHRLSEDLVYFYRCCTNGDRVFLYSLKQKKLIDSYIKSNDPKMDYFFADIEVFYKVGNHLFFLDNYYQSIYKLSTNGVIKIKEFDFEKKNFDLNELISKVQLSSPIEYMEETKVAHVINMYSTSEDFIQVFEYPRTNNYFKIANSEYALIENIPYNESFIPFYPFAEKEDEFLIGLAESIQVLGPDILRHTNINDAMLSDTLSSVLIKYYF